MAVEPTPERGAVAKLLRRPFSLSDAWRLSAWRTPWYQGWNILAVSLVFQAVSFAFPIICFTFFAEQWVAEFGVPRSEIMLAAMMPMIVGAAMGPFAGRAFDSMSIRALVAGGMTALVVGLVLLSVATAVWQVVLIYGALMSLAIVFAGSLPAQLLAARWFPRRRGFAIGISSTGVSIGGVLIPPLVAWMIAALGWRQTLVIFAFVCAAFIVPLVLAVIRNRPSSDKVESREGTAEAPARDGEEFTVRAIVRERNFWVLALIVVPIMTGISGFQANLAAYTAERGITTGQAAGLLSLMALMLLVAKFVWGHLADRHEHRILFCVAATASAVAYMALAFGHGLVGIGATMMILGLGSGGLLPLMGASLSYQFGRSFGRATGLMALCFPVTSIGAPGIAWIEEQLGSYTPAMIALGSFVALAGVAALFLKTSRA